MKDCNGINCKQYERLHSRECLAQYAAAIAGGLFVKASVTDDTFIRGWEVGARLFRLRSDAVKYVQSGQSVADGNGNNMEPLYKANHTQPPYVGVGRFVPNAEYDELKLTARRYAYLRSGRAYEPEEAGVRGGDDLDELCDDGIAGGLYGE